ncbi:MAG: hypothetical protein H6959_05730 [Chromatiaceae bacterium]|nr:hypothetical protein [Gammaproteobacteria bacterium]MCP5300324.1 hypothetical protein [Chromatiaceae bacterium]MCP5422396.1 hypothetical protein [Chromatiaceae bacterium]
MTSSDDLAATSWRRVGPPLLWHREPGSGAVFDPASGQTHFLNELPAMLLAEIQADWRDGASLVEAAAGPVDLNPNDRAKIHAALHFLASAELVESRDDESIG